MKKAMLIVGHGSKSESAVDAFNKMIDHVRSRCAYDIVAGAHMELAEPTIEKAVEDLTALKPDEIVITPYFLYEGMHIKRDIPEIVGKLSKKYSAITFRIAKPIGFEPVLADILIQRADEAMDTEK